MYVLYKWSVLGSCGLLTCQDLAQLWMCFAKSKDIYWFPSSARSWLLLSVLNVLQLTDVAAVIQLPRQHRYASKSF